MTPRKLERLHLACFVYGEKYLDRFSEIVLPNLLALTDEITLPLQQLTRLKILTDREGADAMARARILPEISKRIGVDVHDDAIVPSTGEAGSYAPMVLNQSRLVAAASREKAGIIFYPPDLIWSSGSFRTIIEAADRGYRAVIGPSARGIEEALDPILREHIRKDATGKLELSSRQLTELLFAHWHDMNNGFVWNQSKSNIWKSYVYYRVGECQLLMKFFQGPTMFLWPRRPIDDYRGFIDHRLIAQCVAGMHEICVIDDARRLMTLDLASGDRRELHFLTDRPRWDLFRQLLNWEGHSRYNLLYGKRTCRIYNDPAAEWQSAERQFDASIVPIIYLALALRPLTHPIGRLLCWLRFSHLFQALRARLRQDDGIRQVMLTWRRDGERGPLARLRLAWLLMATFWNRMTGRWKK
jgi:hypothetical protein